MNGFYWVEMILIKKKQMNKVVKMKFKICILGILLFNFLVLQMSAQKNDFPVLKGPYLGQEPPGKNPELFLPGLITTLDVEYCISYLDQGRVCVFGRNDMGINYTYIKDGRWTDPQKMQLEPQLWEWKHNAGPDDRTLYFMSRRLTDFKDDKEEVNIYKMEWTGIGWTEREMLSCPPNSIAYHEIYPSVTADGTIYFHGGDFRNAPVIHQDIYRSRCVNGIYQEQERLHEPINTEYGEYDAFAAPDESYLIFGSNRPGGFGRYDSYICFLKEDGTWTHPANLGNPMNSMSWENRVMVTPDGQYLFFVSGRSHVFLNDELDDGKNTSTTGFYWVKTDFIQDMRLRMLHTECAAEIVASEYDDHGIHAAIDKLSELLNQKEGYHFLPYEFLMLCGRMIETDREDDAEQLYRTLFENLEEESRFQRGYGMICIMYGLTERGLVLLKNAQSGYPVEFMVTTYEQAEALLRKSKIDDAFKVMQFNVREHPAHYISHFGLARVYERLGYVESAIASCEKALALNPEYGDALELVNKLRRNASVRYEALLAEARGAEQNKDYCRAMDAYRELMNMTPHSPYLHYQTARLSALSGRPEKALSHLKRALSMGFDFGDEMDPVFDSIRKGPDFSQIEKLIEQMRLPVSTSQRAFMLPEKDLIPEGMAYDPVEDCFYVSSIWKCKIVRIDRQGRIADFTREKQDGLREVLGMEVDARRRILWAVSGVSGKRPDIPDTQQGWGALFKYDLNTGCLIRKYILDDPGVGHVLNDMALTEGGDVYITDTGTGAIYTVQKKTDRLKLFLEAGAFLFPNGIALGPDDNTLFVASLDGVYKINISDKTFRFLSHSEDVSLYGIDGMYFYNNSLVCVQNGNGLVRISRFFLNKESDTVVNSEILEYRNPDFDWPTTGVISGDEFYYLANAQIRSFDSEGRIFPMDQLQEVVVLKTSLKKDRNPLSKNSPE